MDNIAMCTYQTNGVVCQDKSKCGRCGFNRRVYQTRLHKIRHDGPDALSKIAPKTVDELYIYDDTRRYIKEHFVLFGGDMELDEIRKKMGIEPSKLWWVGRVAADIVNERRGNV